MKRFAVLLLIVALATAGLSAWGLAQNNAWQTPPWDDRQPLSNLSAAAASPDGALIAIGASKQEISRFDTEGSLKYRIRNGSEVRNDFTEAIADGSGGIVALVTALDDYGLYVAEERIVRYDASGRLAHALYSKPGDGTSKRVGQLKGLQVRDGFVYFFETGIDSAVLKRAPLDGGAVSDVFSFTLPDNRYLSEATGTAPGQIYYTTKRGSIYRVSAEGTSKLLYPLQTMERTRKNFPENLSLDASGRLLFIDRLLNAVTAMEPGNPASLQVLLDDAAVRRLAPDSEGFELMDVKASPDGGYTVVLSDRLLLLDGRMNAAGDLQSTVLSGADIRNHWLLWIAFAIGTALLAVAARLAYVHLFRRRFPLFLKQLLVIVPVVLVCMILLSNFIYNSFAARMEDQMQNELLLLARNGQQLIDGDLLERLQSPEDYGNEDYNAIRDRMNFLFDGQEAEQRKGLYSTLYKFEGEKAYIIMDDDDGVNMFRPAEDSEENEAVRTQGTVLGGRWKDAEGQWIYAQGPVYNSAGNIVGIYETGRDLSVLYQENQKIYQSIIENIVIMTSVLLAVILLLNFLLLSSIRKLRRKVLAMANGNWDVEVNIRSRDEVGDLGEQFNRMGRYIRQYIADITAFSEASYRFVPQQFFRALGKKGILDIRLGDQVQQNMSVLVANIRGFRQLSSTLTPKENFNFMNSFLRRFGPLVRKEDGLVSKYSGAGFMSLFPGHVEAAIRSAIAIRQELSAYNEHRKSSGYAPVDIGIAIHRGPLMMGIIGEEMRWEGNVISDDVQRTALLEQMSDTLGASVLVTREFFGQLRDPERYRHRRLGRIRPEGMEEAIELIDVYEGDPEEMRKAKDRTKALFERGLALCQEGRFYDARETFVEVLKQNRLDKAAKLYFYLCDEYYQKGTSAGWNGTLAV